MKLTLQMRERCSMEAFQMWLDAKSEGKMKVIAVRAEAPCRIEIDIEDGEPQ